MERIKDTCGSLSKVAAQIVKLTELSPEFPRYLLSCLVSTTSSWWLKMVSPLWACTPLFAKASALLRMMVGLAMIGWKSLLVSLLQCWLSCFWLLLTPSARKQLKFEEEN